MSTQLLISERHIVNLFSVRCISYQINAVVIHTVIGKNCLIASQTGIAGCVVIEDDVTLWGQVGTNSGITIGEKAVVMGQTGVTKSIAGGKSYFGTPIEESREKLKQLAYIKKIPEIIKKLEEK